MLLNKTKTYRRNGSLTDGIEARFRWRANRKVGIPEGFLAARAWAVLQIPQMSIAAVLERGEERLVERSPIARIPNVALPYTSIITAIKLTLHIP